MNHPEVGNLFPQRPEQLFTRDQAQGLVERDQSMGSEPLAGVTMPHDMEAKVAQVFFHMVEPGEG